ncbi:hypothetical protein HOE37_00125 [Candidatus Woesearchaeota archaeon]|jgi:hypothetical protein|nr:hypothetical protein [Candidatus Woesearchaeota archaeon]MBT4110243.1 hypothetical protein [Candidatus Woesearchaeota archaeon]MBT4336233.1 hypothetical protein [Candidatus Woesearchaeota archaeon]MBT4468788.1 hypothetical protein [Candidatus Woesearchaeota archaeon]MBT6744893.1 hypothetical protein [Candidatus Woesearchaeota archaeon]
MRKKKEKLFSKIIIVLFLIMIAVGFMIPGSIDSNNDSQGYVEPRICQVDVDCYLICEDKPVKVLCSQNLCVQNTCEEGNYYSFNDNPLSFELVVEGNGTSLDLIGKDEDLFVKFSGNQVSLYSSGLSLGHVLEKVGMKIDSEFSMVYVNNEQNYAYSEFVPKEGDSVKIVYE